VTLALQSHAPVIRDNRDVLRMVEEVGSPHLKVSLDVPIMPDKSRAAIQEAARAVGALQVLSHFGGATTRSEARAARSRESPSTGTSFAPCERSATRDT
jgi:hypothetical protein